MFDLQASLGLIQLNRLEEMQSKRSFIANEYNKAFSNIKGIDLPEIEPGTTTHAWHLYMILIDEEVLGITRDKFIDHLNELNIGTSVHFIPVHLMTAYKNRFGYKHGDLPHTENWFNKIISLPLYSKMSEEDVKQVINAVYKIIEGK